MSTVEPIFQINFTFTNQIITAKQIPIIDLNIQNRVLWKSSFKFKTSEISECYVEFDLWCTNLNAIFRSYFPKIGFNCLET